MQTDHSSKLSFPTLFDVIAESGLSTSAAALSGQLLGSEDVLTDFRHQHRRAFAGQNESA